MSSSPGTSRLHRILFAHRCTSTHQKLVLDALCHLRRDDAADWHRLFLRQAEPLLAGATAPDEKFKDFRNHIMSMRGKTWGGAIEAAETWYKNTVEMLKAKNWAKAAYAAGVLSHYYSDPLMPLNTAQTTEGFLVQRACERSVMRSYDQLTAILERDFGGYPDVKVPSGNRWLAEMVRTGARVAHAHYDVIIDHYDLTKAARNPAGGLDDEIRVRLAECLGHSVVGIARILDRAIAEAGAAPAKAGIAIAGFSAWLGSPASRWTRRRSNARERRVVKAMVKEFRKTGTVTRTLPTEVQAIRKLHAEHVLRTTVETLDAIKPRAIGSKHGTGTYLRPMTAAKPGRKAAASIEASEGGEQSPSDGRNSKGLKSTAESSAPRLAKPVPRLAKFHLDPTSSLADAPSVGNRTSEKLAAIGIRTVADLLAKQPADIATRLKLGHIKPDVVAEWQVQARLACRVPNLRALDVKVLVACGITQPEELAACEALDLLDRVDLFISTSEGQRAIRGGGTQPDLDVVTGWIESARNARTLKAA